MEQDGFGSQKPLDDLPRSPSGRVPQWVIDEAQGRGSQPAVPWRGASPSPQTEVPKRRGWTRVRSALASVVIVLVVIGAVAWLGATGTLKRGPSESVTAQPANAPKPGHEESAHPLGVPAPLVTTSASYRFVAHQSDGTTPVTYDPCRPIHYVTRARGAPPGGDQIITDAVSRVSQATGLRFMYDGATSEAPSPQRSPYQPGRYGDRWAPVLISWATANENPDFAADVTGEGGSNRVGLPGRPHAYVTGAIQLDAAKLTSVLQRPNGERAVRSVVLHELGHLVGLAHISSPSQLMYPRVQPGVTDFGAGDLTGLAALGKGACMPDL